MTDIIESVALQETALSHILNAEGEKIQKMVALPDVTPEVLLATNKSVESMVNAVSRLEMILQSKLSTLWKLPVRRRPAAVSKYAQEPSDGISEGGPVFFGTSGWLQHIVNCAQNIHSRTRRIEHGSQFWPCQSV